MRTFNMILLKSFDMTEGEVFSGVISVNEDDNKLIHSIRDAYFCATAVEEAFCAYWDQCIARTHATGVEVLPEKIISVVMTEIV